MQYEAEIANHLGLSPRRLLEQFGKKRASQAVRKEPVASPHELPDQEARVLSVLLSDWPDSVPLVDRVPVELFSHPIARELFAALKEFASQPGTLDFSSLTTHLGSDAGPVAAQLLLREGSLRAEGAAAEGSEGLGRIHIPLMQLKIRLLEETARNLQPDIQSAASTGDRPAAEAATRKKQDLAEEIRRLKAELRAETARRI